MINIGIIGLGHWGPNYLRIFSELDNTRVIACSDLDMKRLEPYPELKTFTDFSKLLELDEIDAIVVATETSSHFTIAREVIAKRKHLLVEKPLTTSSDEAMHLIDMATQAKLVLLTGHTLLFNEGIKSIKKHIDNSDLGDIYYLHATRTNLGPIRADVNVLADLATHDISVFLYLLDMKPEAVYATGASYIRDNNEDVVFLTLYFPGNRLGHIHVSWLEPRKVRLTTVIGDKKMLVFNDMNSLEPIRIYDKGVIKTKQVYREFHEFKTSIWDGDVVIPKINLSEPLKNQCQYFVKMIEAGKQSTEDAAFTLNVVKVMEAASKSLKERSVIKT
jgi:predicted dehydrogenase